MYFILTFYLFFIFYFLFFIFFIFYFLFFIFYFTLYFFIFYFYFLPFLQADFLVLEDDSGRLGLGGKIINELAPSTVTGAEKNDEENEKVIWKKCETNGIRDEKEMRKKSDTNEKVIRKK